jgi:DNA-binding CsgD family transcriptional regulator
MDQLHAFVLMRQGPVTRGYPLLTEAAARIAGVDPELAIVMLAESALGASYAADVPAMAAAAARAHELLARCGSPRARFFAHMAMAMAMVLDGEGERGSGHARLAVTELEQSDELRDELAVSSWAMLGPMYLREAGTGRNLIERTSALARERGAAGNLPILLQMLARDQAASDAWTSAEANLDEAIRLAEETGQRSELAAALAGLAWLQARQGREQECRENAARASQLCAELGLGLYGLWAVQALGDLELGLGHPAQSVAHHRSQVERMRDCGIRDVDLSPAPELVDAYLRLGRPDEAAGAAAGYVEPAEGKRQPWARARAARCRGMVAEGPASREAFEQALELHAQTPDLFEAARTHLAYGARLRRDRRRTESRRQLRAAHELLEQLGSRAWAEQARLELAASGETARRRHPSTLDELTPQEFQIARLLAAGMTTREAAAAAFLSPKTVEYHLRNAYRKLGIRSRQELTAAIASGTRAG